MPKKRKIIIYPNAADMRCEERGFSALLSSNGMDMYDGNIYMFFNKKKKFFKAYCYTKNGFVGFRHKLEQGKFQATVNKKGNLVLQPDESKAMYKFFAEHTNVIVKKKP